MVAFSGVAMANDLEVKVVQDTGCYEQAADYVDNRYDPDGTHTEAESEAAYQGYYAACEDQKETPRITAG